jgi:hypothetical protein
LSAAELRPARSFSRGAVLLQAANPHNTSNGMTPGHHLPLHLKSPRIRHPV